MSREFEVTYRAYQRLQRLVERARKRAVNSGLPLPELRLIETFDKKHPFHDPLARMRGHDSDIREAVIPMVKGVLENDAPQFGEWRVVGYRTISARGRASSKPIVNYGDIPAGCNHLVIGCDHCGLKRRRKHSVIVSHAETGKSLEVGTSCSDAFFGGMGDRVYLEEMSDLARAISEAKETSSSLSPEDAQDEPRDVIAFALSTIERHGFVSTSAARASQIPSTYSLVTNALGDYRKRVSPADWENLTAADFLRAEDAVSWSLEQEHKNSFWSELCAVIREGVRDYRHVALLCAGASIYLNAMERENEHDALRAALAYSEHVGAVGDRLDMVARVHRIHQMSGRYGPVYFVTLSDPTGNLYSWRGSNLQDIRVGQAYEIKGTIKDHGLCNGGPLVGLPQTWLTRVKVASCLGRFDLTSVKPDDDSDLEDGDLIDLAFASSL